MATIYKLIEQAREESQNQKAKKAGFTVALSGELYIRTLGRNSTVYIERIGSQWEAWRETHLLGKKEPVHHKMIAAARGFEYVLLRTKKYFDYVGRKRNTKN